MVLLHAAAGVMAPQIPALMQSTYITAALTASEYQPFCLYVFALVTKILMPSPKIHICHSPGNT